MTSQRIDVTMYDMTTATAPLLASPGTHFVNGNELHARGFNWHEALTVVSVDPMAYGTTRYVVSDRYGRHGYAY